MSRFCDECGSDDLAMVERIDGAFWRKECQDCGSTGPFSPEPTDNEIANRYGVEGGVGYAPEPAYSEHDSRL
jgi:hypothetical protein